MAILAAAAAAMHIIFLILPLSHSASLPSYPELQLPATADQVMCVYTVYIRTGSIIKAGTDSNIGLQFYDSLDNSITVDKLIDWGGLMPEGHDYYERGNLDIFSGKGECLATPICKLKLTSDGSGPHAGWYNNYVEVTSTGPHISCSQHLFNVEQWIATDAPPYSLTAIRDDCNHYSNPAL